MVVVGGALVAIGGALVAIGAALVGVRRGLVAVRTRLVAVGRRLVEIGERLLEIDVRAMAIGHGPPVGVAERRGGRYGGQARLATGQVMLRARLDEHLAHGVGHRARQREAEAALARRVGGLLDQMQAEEVHERQAGNVEQDVAALALQAPQGVLEARRLDGVQFAHQANAHAAVRLVVLGEGELGAFTHRSHLSPTCRCADVTRRAAPYRPALPRDVPPALRPPLPTHTSSPPDRFAPAPCPGTAHPLPVRGQTPVIGAPTGRLMGTVNPQGVPPK